MSQLSALSPEPGQTGTNQSYVASSLTWMHWNKPKGHSVYSSKCLAYKSQTIGNKPALTFLLHYTENGFKGFGVQPKPSTVTGSNSRSINHFPFTWSCISFIVSKTMTLSRLSAVNSSCYFLSIFFLFKMELCNCVYFWIWFTNYIYMNLNTNSQQKCTNLAHIGSM